MRLWNALGDDEVNDIEYLKTALQEIEEKRNEAYDQYKYYKKEYYKLLDKLIERMSEHE